MKSVKPEKPSPTHVLNKPETPDAEVKLSYFGRDELEELDRQIRDSQDPVRYMIVSDLAREVGEEFYYNVAEDFWTTDVNEGSLFKRVSMVETVRKVLRTDWENEIIQVRVEDGMVRPSRARDKIPLTGRRKASTKVPK